MSKLPETIFVWLNPSPDHYGGGWDTDPTNRNIRYVRCDVADARIKALVEERDEARRIADHDKALWLTAEARAAELEAEAEPISDGRIECEALCNRFLAGEASEKEVVDTIRQIARANERLVGLLGEAKARYAVSAEWAEKMMPADEDLTPAAGAVNDEAAMHIETALAMARVQDGYASKATGEGEKMIFKANAKAQRQIAAYIKRTVAPAPDAVEALVKAAGRLSSACYAIWNDNPDRKVTERHMREISEAQQQLVAPLAALRGASHE